MNCIVCGTELMDVHVTPWGSVFSDDYRQELAARTERLFSALLLEPIDEIPAEVTVADFERWALKVAVHFIDSLKTAGKFELIASHLQRPEFMSLEIKERVCQHIPDGYVTIQRNPSPLPPDWFYSFVRPIPKGVVLAASMATGLFEPGALGDPSWKGGDRG